MENITFQNIVIDGISYNKLVSLNITHDVGNHAYASVELEVEKEKGIEYIKRADEGTKVIIKTNAEGQHKILFVGCVLETGLNEMSDYAVLNVRLASYSYRLDIQKRKKTFQNTSLTYGNVMKNIVGSKASIVVEISDKKIGNLIMQYEETDWDFIKRMASHLSAAVFTDIDSDKPQIHIGIPKRAAFTYVSSTSLETFAMPIGMNPSMNNKKTGLAKSVQTEEYMYIGEKMKVDNMSYVIGSVNCSMQLGVLKCTYSISDGNNYKCLATNNSQIGGRMFVGQVKAVKGDQVQVHFTDIDSDYDAGGDKWFPYSTAYSSSDGSGFYCMPEEGDTVRVFVPSNNEKDAFVASSVNGNPQSNTRDKSWKAPGGKEILLADDGIYIICEKEKIYINLSKDNGIEIHSEKPISITSDSNIILQSGNEIQMKADTCINMGVGNSSIYMDAAQIEIGAESVYIN